MDFCVHVICNTFQRRTKLKCYLEVSSPATGSTQAQSMSSHLCGGLVLLPRETQTSPVFLLGTAMFVNVKIVVMATPDLAFTSLMKCAKSLFPMKHRPIL